MSDTAKQELERLTEDQETIGAWALANFGRPTVLAVLRRSCDELLEAMEVCVIDNTATRTMFRAMRMGLEHLDNYALPNDRIHNLIPLVAEELADSEIVNKHAATVMNVNLNSFVQKKMEVNRRRKWKSNGDGTGQHVDEDVILNSIDEEE